MKLVHEQYVRVSHVQYIPRNMHTVFALLCFVVVIHWLIFPYPSGLLHWHCGNLTIAPVPAKQLWWIWINTSCEFIVNDCITTTKQSTTKPCAYFLGYTVQFSGDIYAKYKYILSITKVWLVHLRNYSCLFYKNDNRCTLIHLRHIVCRKYMLIQSYCLKMYQCIYIKKWNW